MLRSTQGLALISVLLFLLLTSALSMYLMQSQAWQIKKLQLISQSHARLLVAENILRTIETDFQDDNPSCMIPFASGSYLAKLSLSAWQQISCSGNFNSFQYYYVVENINDDACGRIIEQTNEKRSAIFFRLSLLVNDLYTDEKTLLQATEVKIDNIHRPCPMEYHLLHTGRQSWRQII